MTRTPEQHQRLALAIGRCELAGLVNAKTTFDDRLAKLKTGPLDALDGDELDLWLETLEWTADEAEAAQLGYQLDQGRQP